MGIPFFIRLNIGFQLENKISENADISNWECKISN